MYTALHIGSPNIGHAAGNCNRQVYVMLVNGSCNALVPSAWHGQKWRVNKSEGRFLTSVCILRCDR